MFSGSMWMFNWRSRASSSTHLRYTRERQLHSAPNRADLHCRGHAARGRDGRVSPDRGRGVARLLLPDRGHGDAQRTRFAAPRRRRQALDDRRRARRGDYLCVRRRRGRRGDRRRDPVGSARRAEEVEGDQRAARPLHHLRLRPRRPPRRAGVPCRGCPLRRTRLQRGREGRCAGARRSLHRGQRNRGRGSRQGRARPRARARRLLGFRRRQPLHHALRPLGAPRHLDRRARDRRGRGEEAEARRRRPRRRAVFDRRPRDGEPRPQAAGDGVSRRRDDGARRRLPARGDRGHADVPAGRPDDPRAEGARRDGRDHRRPAQERRHVRHHALTGRADRGRRRADRRRDPAHGDYATNVALRLAPAQRRPPRELAEELAERAAELPEVELAEVAGPGFLNLFVTDAFLAEALAEIGEDHGRGSAERPERVNVEMVSANPTGPIPVSAARNGAYGDSVARLLTFAGHRVEREYYYNDAGRQIELFRGSVDARRRGEPIPEDGYKGEYVEELAKIDGDPVGEMLRQIEATLERFRVHFDSWALQSKLEEELPELLPRLDTYERDGALYARSSAYGDDADWVLIRSGEK